MNMPLFITSIRRKYVRCHDNLTLDVMWHKILENMCNLRYLLCGFNKLNKYHQEINTRASN